MLFLKTPTSRRALVQALLALPVLSLFRSAPASGRETSEGFVEVDGWILKRSDLL